MVENCRICGGSVQIEHGPRAVITSKCLDCGYRRYLSVSAVTAPGGQIGSAAPKAHKSEAAIGCRKWYDCFDCPFKDCPLTERQKALETKGRVSVSAK